MEVLLATGILLGCTVVLVELSNQGRRHSMAALEQATAQTICSSYVNEILAGLREATTQEAAPIEEYPGWTVAILVEPLEQGDLSVLTVTAEQEENRLGKIQSYSLMRWIPSSEALGGSGSPDFAGSLNSNSGADFPGTDFGGPPFVGGDSSGGIP